ncbi:MAG: hypothetical protein ACMXYB_03105 [Candidatus Woesearchaeota archaeon]
MRVLKEMCSLENYILEDSYFFKKATMNWIFDYGKSYKLKEIRALMQTQKGVYQEKEVF